MDDDTRLEITKLKWRIQVLQGILVKLWTHCVSATTEMPPLAAHQQLLAELDTTREQQYTVLLTAGHPEAAQALAEVIEEMKTFMTSMLENS